MYYKNSKEDKNNKSDWFRGFKEIKTRKYQSGGSFKSQVVKGQNGLKLIESVNNRSKANFVQRLNNSERQHIQDWETPNKIATHKMSWATEGEKAIVFPMVQEINGSLHDFSNPKYNHKKWDALNNAISKGDTLIMTSDQAKWFTENYKNFYPKFKKGGGVSFKSDKSMRQESDNTYVEKPKVEEPIEQSVNGVKWSDLDFKTQMMNRGNLVDGYPTEKGLEIVSPEFDIISGVRGITNLLPKTQTFYHGSPVRFNKFNTQFIGSGEGGSKAMKGINLWPDNHFGAAPKFANIRSSDAPLHLGRASKEISGELNPTIYKVRGRNLNIYSSNTSKGLDQQELVNLGYDGFSNGKQYTIFPESVNKLKIKKHYSIPEFVKTHKKIDSWAPWSTDINKMNNILELAGSSKRF